LRFTIDWIRDYIDVEWSPEELADRLTMVGLEVSSLEKQSDDAILEVELTPNRPDCLGIIGIAREISALSGKPLRIPEATFPEKGEDVHQILDVCIEDPDGCPRYAGRVIQGISVKSSPSWLRDRLERVGIRSINNVVDVTNYVMLETGHPLHAFDFDRITESRIIVRKARGGERFVTLDGKEHILTPEVLLICDGLRPVALAGIMGGLNSEVTQVTIRVLLECAYFDPVTIRRGAKSLGISSESSMRFERGVDPNGIPFAINRAAQLILKTAGGRAARGIWDNYPRKIHPVIINLRPEQVNRVLGTELPRETIRKMMEGLGFQVHENQTLEVTVPTFRPDITREIDLIEEVARIYGYQNIRESQENLVSLTTPRNLREIFLDRTRQILIGMGFREILTNSMISRRDLERTRWPEKAISIRNPVSEDMAFLRPSLLPGVLEVVQRNVHRNRDSFRLFEIGRVFQSASKGELLESLHLAGAITGNFWPSHWLNKTRPVNFYDLKGFVEELLQQLGITGYQFSARPSWIFDDPSVCLLVKGEERGFLGAISQQTLENYDLKQSVLAFEIDLEGVFRHVAWEKTYRPVPRFPAVKRDLALLVDWDLPAEELVQAIQKWGGTYLRSIKVFDVYQGKPVPEGKKSIAVTLEYLSGERTLTEAEVHDAVENLLHKLKEEVGAELRPQ